MWPGGLQWPLASWLGLYVPLDIQVISETFSLANLLAYY